MEGGTTTIEWLKLVDIIKVQIPHHSYLGIVCKAIEKHGKSIKEVVHEIESLSLPIFEGYSDVNTKQHPHLEVLLKTDEILNHATDPRIVNSAHKRWKSVLVSIIKTPVHAAIEEYIAEETKKKMEISWVPYPDESGQEKIENQVKGEENEEDDNDNDNNARNINDYPEDLYYELSLYESFYLAIMWNLSRARIYPNKANFYRIFDFIFNPIATSSSCIREAPVVSSSTSDISTPTLDGYREISHVTLTDFVIPQRSNELVDALESLDNSEKITLEVLRSIANEVYFLESLTLPECYVFGISCQGESEVVASAVVGIFDGLYHRLQQQHLVGYHINRKGYYPESHKIIINQSHSREGVSKRLYHNHVLTSFFEFISAEFNDIYELGSGQFI